MMQDIVFLVDIIHRFNTFLGTDPGRLLVNGVEAVLLTVVSYMIISEWTRDRKNRELFYLSFAFSILGLSKVLLAILYAIMVFGQLPHQFVEPYIPLVKEGLTVIGIVFLSNAFVYPAFRRAPTAIRLFSRKLKTEMLIAVIFTVVVQIYWLYHLDIFPMDRFRTDIGFFLFDIAKIVLLMYPVYFIYKTPERFDKFGINVAISFVVFTIEPICDFVDFLFYGGVNSSIEVFSQPFPFIAILLFTRVVFLKLVDKANLQAQLAQAKEDYIQAKEVVRLKDEFVSVVSHELRTPLTAIRLYASLMRDGRAGKLTKKQHDNLYIIIEEAKRLGNLINDILALAKLEAKKDPLRIEKVGLQKLVKDNTYFYMAESKSIGVEIQIPAKMNVHVDVDKFKQVYINLYSNAIKYTESGGKIIVKARVSKGLNILEVRDTGIGISKEHLPHLFNKFYQPDNYSTRSQGGTGLGLAIVKHIADLHDGTIEVKSTVGKGSQFIFSWPNRLPHTK